MEISNKDARLFRAALKSCKQFIGQNWINWSRKVSCNLIYKKLIEIKSKTYSLIYRNILQPSIRILFIRNSQLTCVMGLKKRYESKHYALCHILKIINQRWFTNQDFQILSRKQDSAITAIHTSQWSNGAKSYRWRNL